MNQNELKEMETSLIEVEDTTQYPLLGDRIQSVFIDTVFIVVLMYIASSILENYSNVPDWVRIALFVCIWFVYDPVCTSLGCTLGNYIKKLRIRQFNDSNRRINIFQAALRYAVKLSLGWISFITINFNKEKRAIHDFIAGSVVIKI